MGIDELPTDLSVMVLTFATKTPSDLSSHMLISRHWASLVVGSNAWLLWYHIAVQRYGKKITDATKHLYHNDVMAMMKDDNRKGAIPILPLNDLSCRYVGFQRPDSYCCVLTELQWDRVTKQFKLYLDARGEWDLRHPQTSAIMMDDVNGEKTIFPTETWDSELIEPRRRHPTIPGHYKGYLTIPESTLLLHTPVAKISFCYANYNQWMLDYETVELLSASKRMNDSDQLVPLDIPKSFTEYTLRDVSPYDEETKTIELRRWQAIFPQEVVERLFQSE
mmetsp:Transcript_6304/g.9697  ORF Transcript_6304/g.9697 Transcript_6304/m.9697 type:complete len:278 (-) Transcript_6304:116-949(-)